MQGGICKATEHNRKAVSQLLSSGYTFSGDTMTSPIFDFSHLSAEERIQLAEDLWDSLEPQQVRLPEELNQELDRRLQLHRQDPSRGRPAEDVLRDLEQRGR
jgi:putative addiction module component (TIGR02574 family)